MVERPLCYVHLSLMLQYDPHCYDASKGYMLNEKNNTLYKQNEKNLNEKKCKEQQSKRTQWKNQE